MKNSNKMHSITALALAACLILAITSCGGTAGDPKTADRSDLNAPGTIFTVTGSESVQIRFPTGNFEKEFKGYYVFGTNSTQTALTALVKYPTTGVDITKAGIPRCKKNATQRTTAPVLKPPISGMKTKPSRTSTLLCRSQNGGGFSSPRMQAV